MARLRAVVMIQPPGFGGAPVVGPALARPRRRRPGPPPRRCRYRRRGGPAWPRPVRTRSRKTRSMSTESVAARHTELLRLGLVLERPHLDRAPAGDRRLGGPGQRGVEIGRLDDPEAAELLLRLGERAVGRHDLAALRLDDGRRVRRVQPAAEDPGALRPDLLVDGIDVGVDPLDLIGRGLRLRLRPCARKACTGSSDSPLCAGTAPYRPLAPSTNDDRAIFDSSPKFVCDGPQKPVRGDTGCSYRALVHCVDTTKGGERKCSRAPEESS